MKAFTSKSGKIAFNYIKEIDETYRFHLTRLSNALNEEDIHYLRRASKRLKALFKLFGNIDSGFNAKKRFNYAAKISDPAGKLRELQVNQNVLMGYNVSPNLIKKYSNYLVEDKTLAEKVLKKAIKKFDNKAHKKSLRKIEKICRKLSSEDIKVSISAFLNTMSFRIKEYVEQNQTEANYHTIRILLKTISPSIVLSDVIEKNENVKKLYGRFKSAEDKLGAWHDKVMLQKSLQQFFPNNGSHTTEELEAEMVIKEIETDKSILLDEAQKQVKTLIEDAV